MHQRRTVWHDSANLSDPWLETDVACVIVADGASENISGGMCEQKQRCEIVSLSLVLIFQTHLLNRQGGTLTSVCW